MTRYAEDSVSWLTVWRCAAFVLIVLLILLIPILGIAQERLQDFTLTWTPSVVIEEKDAEGNIIKTNKPEGYKIYRHPLVLPRVLLGEVEGHTTNTYKTPVLRGIEGENECFDVTAFNHTHPIGDPLRVLQESPPTPPGCTTYPVTPVTTFPVNHIGNVSTLPQYAQVDIQVSKPANATKSFLQLDVFDADFVNEGTIEINGKGPFGLFLNATDAGNNVVTTQEMEVPLADWVEGANRLRFVHTSTGGYRIDAARVRFETLKPDPPLPPTAVNIVVAFPAVVNVSRRATDTSSIVAVLVNKDSVLTPEGMLITVPEDKKLLVSRRATNTSSIVAVLVNRNQEVTVNGEPR